MTDKTQAELLAVPFPPEQLRRHQAKNLTYIPISEVIARLNRVLGTGRWGTSIVSTAEHGTVETETGTYPKWIVAIIRLHGTVDGEEFSYVGAGGQEVQFTKNNKGPVDIGDNYKGAVSDAIKKAAQSLGVALDLAREDDAIAIEMALKQADEPKAAEATLQAIQSFLTSIDKDTEPRKSFGAWWTHLTGNGGPGKKFDSGDITVAEADQAIQHLGIEIKPAKRGKAAPAKPAQEEESPPPDEEPSE